MGSRDQGSHLRVWGFSGFGVWNLGIGGLEVRGSGFRIAGFLDVEVRGSRVWGL